MLFHHDPMHPDHFLDDLSANARWLELGGTDGQVLMAKEGLELEI